MEKGRRLGHIGMVPRPCLFESYDCYSCQMWEACESLRDALVIVGAGIDGGKDSLSMAAKVSGSYVKSPGTLTLTAYAACPDITMTVTPDLKLNGQGGQGSLV